MNPCKVQPVWDLSHDEWQDNRRAQRGLGGSDAGSILGVNKYKPPYALWAQLTGLDNNDFDGNEATEWGQILERPVAEKYAKDYGVAIVAWPVILQSEAHPFMFANIDFLEVEPSDDFPAGQITDWHKPEPPPGVLGIVEVKTTGIATHGNAAAWAGDSIPPSYSSQCYHYGIVTGWHRVTLVCLVGGEGLVIRSLKWDDGIADHIVLSESQFWDLVEMNIPPELDGSETTEAVLARLYPRQIAGKTFEGDADFLALCDEHEQLKQAEKDAITDRKKVRAKIVEAIKDAEVALVDGVPVYSYKAGKDVESIDSDALRKLYPAIATEVTKTRPGARTLRPMK